MKVNRQIIFLAILIILVVSYVSWVSVSGFVPYSENTIFSREFPYEGMTSRISDTASNFSGTESPVIPKITTPKKVEGFQGIQGSPYGSEKPLDVFSQIPGSLSCDTISSGLHNSKGGLCLTPDAVGLLKTRGGNSTGKDSQIGSPTPIK